MRNINARFELKLTKEEKENALKYCEKNNIKLGHLIRKFLREVVKEEK